MSRCRVCRAPKWRGDPCPNADCTRNTTPRVTLKSRTLPITATAKHGYHAGNTMGFVQESYDYDAPIQATRWVTVR
jgi:hypothetical protein